MINFRKLVAICIATSATLALSTVSASANGVFLDEVMIWDGAKFVVISLDPASEGTFGEFTDGVIVLDPTKPPAYFKQVGVSLMDPPSDCNVLNSCVSDFLQIFGEGSSGVDPGTIAYQFGSDPVPGLFENQVAETGDWQNVGRFFGDVNNGFQDSWVQMRSDVESAVPLPGALPLFGGGLAMLGWLSRRKKRIANASA